MLLLLVEAYQNTSVMANCVYLLIPCYSPNCDTIQISTRTFGSSLERVDDGSNTSVVPRESGVLFS